MSETKKPEEQPQPLRLDDPNSPGLDRGALADDSAFDLPIPKPTEKKS